MSLRTRSGRIASLLAEVGLRCGDHVAILMDNDKRFLEIIWATQRSGLYVTPVNWHLSADEARYIVEDCDAAALFVSESVRTLAESIPLSTTLRRRFCAHGSIDGIR